MHVHFERTVNAKSDCTIVSLTWMGKAPDEHSEVVFNSIPVKVVSKFLWATCW